MSSEIRVTDDDGIISEAGIFWDKVRVVTDARRGYSAFFTAAQARALAAAIVASAEALEKQEAEYARTDAELAALRADIDSSKAAVVRQLGQLS